VKSLKANALIRWNMWRSRRGRQNSPGLIPPEAKVGMGGSTSLMQLGIIDELIKRGQMTRSRPDIYLTPVRDHPGWQTGEYRHDREPGGAA